MKMAVITVVELWAPWLCANEVIDYHEVLVRNVNIFSLMQMISGSPTVAQP
jgi:hypothetical protein